jgi:small subunit ribosomal protein S4e
MASNRRHLKRTSMPNSWPIQKKTITFVGKPKPGSHKREYVVSTLILLRDILGYAHNAKEAKYIVNNQEFLVNGRQIKDIKAAIGIFDIIEIPATKEKFTVLFNTFGKITLVPTKSNELYLKVAKKTALKKGRFQINAMNGYNVLVDEKTFKSISVNDTVVYDFSKKKVVKTLPLKEGSFVYLFDGKYTGQFGKVISFTEYHGISKTIASLEIDGVEQSTVKDYCYVIGTNKEDIKGFN